MIRMQKVLLILEKSRLGNKTDVVFLMGSKLLSGEVPLLDYGGSYTKHRALSSVKFTNQEVSSQVLVFPV